MTTLPVGWAPKSLSDVCLPVTKADPVSTGREQVRYVDIGSVDGARHRLPEIPWIDSGSAPSRCRQIIAGGDTVFSTVRPYLEKIAFVDGSLDGEFASTGFCVLRPGPQLLPRYLFHFSVSHQMLEQVLIHQRGVSYPAVLEKDVKAATIPVPPLDEQRRIVDILEDHLSRLDAAETLLNQSKRRLATWSRAVVDTAFWDSALIAEPERDELVESLMRSRKSRWSQSPSGKQSKAPVVADLETFREAQPWPVVSLESATDPNRTIRYGILKPSIGQGGTVRYVEVRDLAGNTLSDKTFRLTSRQLDEQFSASRLAGGDVVIAVRGSYERTAVVPKELNGANLSRDVARIAPLPELLPGLLHYWLQTSSSKAYLNRHARGVAVKGVNISTLRAMPVPLLPLETQRHIVDTLNTQLAAGDRATLEIDRAAKLSETLRRSLLAAAFAGRLTGLASDMEIVEDMAGV